VVNEVTRATGNPDAETRIAMPSGVLTVAASVRKLEGQWYAEQGAFYRTQRRMFEGNVVVRASRVSGLTGGA
jgi:2-methylaconitate cis-trans-isomerase PrpF